MLKMISLFLLCGKLLAADQCSLPGMIQYFALTQTALGSCNSSIAFESQDGVKFGLCSACGTSAGYSNASDPGSTTLGLTSQSLWGPITGQSSYTIQFNLSGAYTDPVVEANAGNVIPAAMLYTTVMSNGFQYSSTFEIDTMGTLCWGYPGQVLGGNLGPAACSDITLMDNTCYQLTFIFDGSAYSIYVNGELAAGPSIPLYYPNPGPSGTVEIMQNECCVPGNVYVSNFSVQSGVHFPDILPIITPTPVVEPTAGPIETAGAIPTLYFPCMPTDTPTPSPSVTPTVTPTLTPTMTPTQTPGCSSCIGAGPITREPQGSTSSWGDDAVPYAATTVTAPSGKQNTMRWIGCGITCLSMIDSTYDPGKMDSLLTDDGDIDEDSNLHMERVAPDLQFSNYIKLDSPKHSEIEDALCGKGSYLGTDNYVIAEVLHTTSSGSHQHFVVITGEALNPGNECDFTIADPSKADYSFLGQYTGVYPPVSIRIFSK